MTADVIICTVGAVFEDGATLILPGQTNATQKRYRGNAAAVLKPGDRVKVTRYQNTLLIDYKIGTPKNT